METTSIAYIRGELKSAILTLILVTVGVWLAVSLAAKDMGLADVVLRLAAASLMGIFCYFLCSIGFERIRVEIAKNSTLQETSNVLASDWVKGAFLLLFWPLFPVYFLVEALHQQLRLWRCEPAHLLKEAREWECAEPMWMAREARSLWNGVLAQEKASVLSKATYIGLAIFGIQVLVSEGLPLALSALNETIASWPLPAIFAVLWLVGIVLFMLPPVPGLPIYLVTGILISKRCEQDNFSFRTACLLGIGFGYFLKASACAIQLRGIGAYFSNSVSVKRLIQVHTPPMRAARHILSQEGFHLDKVALLCGGPDWPTWVIAGIMKQPLWPCLLGGFPVILMIIPMVLTTAFTMRASLETDDEGKAFFNYLSYIMVILSSLVLGGYMALAGFFIDRACEKYEEELKGDWNTDDQEQEVLELIAQEAVFSARAARHVGWAAMPGWLRVLLVVAALLSCVCSYILLLPFQPFRDFTLSDKVSSLPGGKWFGIINELGYVSLGCFAASSALIVVFQLWCAMQLHQHDWDHEELKPLMANKS